MQEAYFVKCHKYLIQNVILGFPHPVAEHVDALKQGVFKVCVVF